MDDLILNAARFAKRAHAGQIRKYHGRQYIEHPARVAARVMIIDGITPEEIAAAFLHDVLEDCECNSADLLAAGMPVRTVKLVEELTNPSKVSPELQNLSRRQKHRIDREYLMTVSDAAKRIKLADVIDNLRDLALAEIDYKGRFVAEKILLLEAIGSVDRGLTEEAYTAIEDLGFPRDHRDDRVE